jgi:hypothetical protein
MIHKQYDQLEIDFPNSPKEPDQNQYKLIFPNPNQYLIEFPKTSEFPDKKPMELPPSKLEELF